MHGRAAARAPAVPGLGRAGQFGLTGALVTLPAAFPAELWPSSRCHVGDKGTLASGGSWQFRGALVPAAGERTHTAGCKLDSPGRGRDPHPGAGTPCPSGFGVCRAAVHLAGCPEQGPR